MLSGITPVFSLVGLVVVLGVSTLLMLFYRDIALREIEEVGERNTATLAHYAATLLAGDLVDLLAHASPSAADGVLRKMTRLRVNLGLKAISVQDMNGTVTVSTVAAEQGRSLKGDSGFERAARGEPASEMVFRNNASRFERRTADADIVHSYVPVRADASSPVVGVLEVYADVSPLVRRMEGTLTEIVVAGAGAFLLVYGALVLVVRRAAGTIEAQQREIEQKNAALRELSAQLQDIEEREKKRLARELHEGVAQTLAAIKYAVESASLGIPAGAAGASPAALTSLVPTLQEAIRDVRSIATDLRPPGLDDFGLLRTLANIAGGLRARLPELSLTEEYAIAESDIPARLKIVIYRIVESVLDQMASSDGAHTARIRLDADTQVLRLTLERDGAPALLRNDDTDVLPLAEKRAVVSGGEFAVRLGRGGDMAIVATWPRVTTAVRAAAG